MATAIQLEPATIKALDAMVASGRFPSRDVAIQTALYLVKESDAFHSGPLTPEENAGIERGLADAAAGRVYRVDEVFDELEQRCLPGR